MTINLAFVIRLGEKGSIQSVISIGNGVWIRNMDANNWNDKKYYKENIVGDEEEGQKRNTMTDTIKRRKLQKRRR